MRLSEGEGEGEGEVRVRATGEADWPQLLSLFINHCWTVLLHRAGPLCALFISVVSSLPTNQDGGATF